MRNISRMGVILVAVASLSWAHVYADVYPSSLFVEARHPASELDMVLQRAQESWWRDVVREPPQEFATKHRLLVEAGVGMEFSYSGEDIIAATAWITNTDGFLRFTPSERKQLVRDALNVAIMTLAADVNVNESRKDLKWIRLDDRHIELHVIISRVLSDDKGRNIRAASFPQIDLGQAAFKKGSFIFSGPYYLRACAILS